MNLYFDEISQKLIVNAKKEMFELKHPYVGSEHLLLAILHDTDLEVTKMLNSYGIYYKRFREELITVVGIGKKSNDWFLFTPLLKRIITNATFYSKDQDHIVTPNSLLISILNEGDGVANRIMLGMNIDLESLYEKFIDVDINNDIITCKRLDEIAINMNEMACNNKYDLVIGRDDSIDMLIQVLLRKNKNNPLLIGEAGVGKTAIVEELAKRIVLGNVPESLKNIIIYNVSMSSLVAGTKYRGEFEEKMKELINEVSNNNNIILFIDEVHTIMGAGGAEGAIDASNILKPYLARGEIKIIGATTNYEYEKYIEKDKAFDRRFQKIYIKEPNKNEVLEIIGKLKNIYEKYHHVLLKKEVIKKIVDYSFECISYGRQPDKAIDLLDEVCSYVAFKNNNSDNKLLIYEEKIRNIKNKKNDLIIRHDFKKALEYKEKELELNNEYNNYLLKKSSDKKNKIISLSDLECVMYKKGNIQKREIFKKKIIKSKRELKRIVFGQDKVINELVKSLLKYDYITNMEPMMFLLIGKNGCGKTFLLDKIVSLIFDDVNCIKINMQDYQNEYAVSQLFGEGVNNNYHTVFHSLKENSFSVIILEDIDNAHPSILKRIIKTITSGYIKVLNHELLSINKCIIFITMNNIDDKIGFMDNRLSNYYDKLLSRIINKIYFNDINEDIITLYINNYLSNYSLSDREKIVILKNIIDKSDYEINGLSKVFYLLEEEVDRRKVKS